MRIAIVGLGAAGLSILRELIEQVPNITDHTLTIYSDKERFKTGLPYQQDDDSLLLNQYAETMSLIPEEPLHFSRWIKKHYGIKETRKKFFPRSWYGEYLQSVGEKWINQSGAIVIKERILSVEVTTEQTYVLSTDESAEEYDIVHLALGHLAYQDPYQLNGMNGYVHVPYPANEVLKGMKEDQHIGILGTGLTSIDLMLYLKKQYPSIQISFFSPDGSFSAVRGVEKEISLTHFSKEAIDQEKEKNNGFIPLNTLKEWFIQECLEAKVDIVEIWEHYGLGTAEGLQFDLEHLEEIGTFQSIIHQMTDHFADLWNALTEEDRHYFVENYAKRFVDFRSPLPVQTAKQLVKYVQDGSVRLYAGIHSIEKINDLFNVKIKNDREIHVNAILNGTGQQKDVSTDVERQQPLIQQLINDRIFISHSFGGVQLSYPTMSVLSDRYGEMETMKVYGQLASGVDYMNNTVELISKSAVRGVKDTIKFLN